jgi:hypothetical protein
VQPNQTPDEDEPDRSSDMPVKPVGTGGQQPPRPARSASSTGESARSVDETDIGWGERPELDDEERLRRDRPPHWG